MREGLITVRDDTREKAVGVDITVVKICGSLPTRITLTVEVKWVA